MADLGVPGFESSDPLRVNKTLAEIEQENHLRLYEYFPFWQDDAAWHEYTSELERLVLKIGGSAVRSLVYDGENAPVLGIFIREEDIPAKGIASLF